MDTVEDILELIVKAGAIARFALLFVRIAKLRQLQAAYERN